MVKSDREVLFLYIQFFFEKTKSIFINRTTEAFIKAILIILL